MSRDLHSLLMSTFSRDIGMRPTADELLLHPFVLAHGASAEAVAAGHQGHLERQNAPPIVPQREATTLALKVRQFSTVEEAADQTLARQAIGLLGPIEHSSICLMCCMLGDDPDIAKGFQLESFRMPPCEEAVDTHGTRQEPPERNAKSGRCGDYDDENRVELSSRPKNRDEAQVNLFICKEAAAQFAGADKHFPGRPPTARPRGAPPPRTARSSQGKSKAEADLAATLPARPNKYDRLQGGRYFEEKSPLLMAQLPPRKQSSSRDFAAPASNRSFGNLTYNCGSLSTNRSQSGKANHAGVVAHGDAQDPRSHAVSQPRPLAWSESSVGHDHEIRPIITEAVRRRVYRVQLRSLVLTILTRSTT